MTDRCSMQVPAHLHWIHEEPSLCKPSMDQADHKAVSTKESRTKPHL